MILLISAVWLGPCALGCYDGRKSNMPHAPQPPLQLELFPMRLRQLSPVAFEPTLIRIEDGDFTGQASSWSAWRLARTTLSSALSRAAWLSDEVAAARVH